MTLPSKAVLWAASQSPLSLGGTEESSPCHSLKVMSRKASGVIPVAEDSPTDRQLSQWDGTEVGCAPGQYLISGRPLPLSPTTESQQQVENGALGEGKAKVLQGGAGR